MKISDNEVEFTTKLSSYSRWSSRHETANRHATNIQNIDEY